jgi:hypothetical protein
MTGNQRGTVLSLGELISPSLTLPLRERGLSTHLDLQGCSDPLEKDVHSALQLIQLR